MEYSNEQSLYIQNPDLNETKLLATAGSGKTFSVIQRIAYMIQHLNVPASSIVMFTFSKHAQKDFKSKVRKCNNPALSEITVSTIDAFALDMLGDFGKSIDISVLSFTFMTFLKERLEKFDIIKQSRMAQIKEIFVDEAQDLNSTQYHILMMMRKRYGSNVHMIGDPNQNIYQFRNSTDRFLIDYEAKSFYLTKNYRSSKQIVDFCNYLRPYDSVAVESGSSYVSREPVKLYAMGDYEMFEKYLVDLITRLNKYTDLHKIAILSPTRGTHSCPSNYRGLCYVAHVLYSNNIKFKQFYSDAGSDLCEESTKSEYKIKRGHISLLTMTASKGLEWDYVILLDVNNYLITKVEYTQEKFKAEQYLLYVAASRPRRNLFIFTKRNSTNPWFSRIPDEKYEVQRSTSKFFEIFDKNKLEPASRSVVSSVTRLIKSINEEELFQITEKFHFELMKESPLNESFEWNMPSIDIRLSPLFGTVMEHIFYVYMTGQPWLLKDVTNAVNNQLIYNSDINFIFWYKQASKCKMNWQLYDEQVQAKRVLPKIQALVNEKFDRNIPFSNNTLISKYSLVYIQNNLEHIKHMYNKYLENPKDTYLLFYVTAVNYAINTMHYYYYDFIDSFYDQLIVKTQIEDVCFEAIRQYAESFSCNSNIQEPVDFEGMMGVADFITPDKKVYEIKTVRDIRLTDKLQVLIYNIFIHEMSKEQYDIDIINLGRGISYNYQCKISKEDQIWLIEKLKKYK